MSGKKRRFRVTIALLNPTRGVVRTLKSNYYKMNWQNMMDDRWNFRTPGILEIWESLEDGG